MPGKTFDNMDFLSATGTQMGFRCLQKSTTRTGYSSFFCHQTRKQQLLPISRLGKPPGSSQRRLYHSKESSSDDPDESTLPSAEEEGTVDVALVLLLQGLVHVAILWIGPNELTFRCQVPYRCSHWYNHGQCLTVRKIRWPSLSIMEQEDDAAKQFRGHQNTRNSRKLLRWSVGSGPQSTEVDIYSRRFCFPSHQVLRMRLFTNHSGTYSTYISSLSRPRSATTRSHKRHLHGCQHRTLHPSKFR